MIKNIILASASMFLFACGGESESSETSTETTSTTTEKKELDEAAKTSTKVTSKAETAEKEAAPKKAPANVNSGILAFAQNPSVLENSDVDGNPIEAFTAAAKEGAAESMILSKSNISEALEKAAKYGNTVIVVDNHTIVRIVDVKDCRDSGSWGACMPMTKGYIKRGKLVEKEDYANNIIGTPDGQNRTVYFFN